MIVVECYVQFTPAGRKYLFGNAQFDSVYSKLFSQKARRKKRKNWPNDFVVSTWVCAAVSSLTEPFSELPSKYEDVSTYSGTLHVQR